MTTHKEHFQALAISSTLNASNAHERGDTEEGNTHQIESVIFELQSQATHQSKCGQHLYKATMKEKVGLIDSLIGLAHDVEFYDRYTNKWSESIMWLEDLIELK